MKIPPGLERQAAIALFSALEAVRGILGEKVSEVDQQMALLAQAMRQDRSDNNGQPRSSKMAPLVIEAPAEAPSAKKNVPAKPKPRPKRKHRELEAGGWLSRALAAKRYGVSIDVIERADKQGKIGGKLVPVPGSPPMKLYNPEQLEAWKKARRR